MPRIVQSFAVYNRSHRISSPNEPQILATGMPNACNLCHLDKSLAWTRDALAKDWNRTPQLSPALQNVFGTDFNRPAGEAWLAHPSPMVRTVAAGAYTRSPMSAQALPTLLPQLAESNPYVRMRMLMSVEQIIGRTLANEEYTLLAPLAKRQQQIQRLTKSIH